MKRKKKQQLIEPPLPLTLSSIDGTPAHVFPNAQVESLRQLLTRLDQKEQVPGRLGVVAALRQEGVTNTAMALAATLANDQLKRVCVLDLNWYWPSESPLVAPDNPGLAAVLGNEAALEDVIAPSGWSNLVLIPAGKLARPNRPVMARSQALRELLNELDQRYDHLILDIPAILATNDSVPLASLSDACCLVIRQGVTPVEDVRLALDEIEHLTILGTVLNQAHYATPAVILKLIPTR